MTSILFQCKIIGKPLNGYISSPQMVINEALEKKKFKASLMSDFSAIFTHLG